MSLDYLIRPAARQDIDAAYAWYESQASGRGDAFLEELRERVEVIRQTPELYGRVRGDVRAIPLADSHYVIYYRIEPGRVSVIAVQHASADPRTWQRRRP